MIRSSVVAGQFYPESPAELTKMLKGMTPHMALSGHTMEFDGKGKCVAGC